MAMALINRISRLFKADFHAVLDRIEEPEQLLRQAIRDMEDDLAESEQLNKVRGHEQQLLSQRKAELNGKLVEIDNELDLCFTSGKDELARDLVRRKLETQRLLQRLQASESANADFLTELRKQMAENRNALEGLKQKAEIFARSSPVESDTGFADRQWMSREFSISENDIEIALLREQNARRVS
jgi:phage shock protein A